MLERGRFKPFLDDGTLTAQLAAQPLELIRLRLTDSLRKLATKLAREVFAALDRFAGGETVGLIEWFGDDACLFHFFGETVVQQETGQHEKRGRKRRRRIDRGTMEVRQTLRDDLRTLRDEITAAQRPYQQDLLGIAGLLESTANLEPSKETLKTTTAAFHRGEAAQRAAAVADARRKAREESDRKLADAETAKVAAEYKVKLLDSGWHPRGRCRHPC